MRAGLWVFENRPTAPINEFFEGVLRIQEVDGLIDLTLTKVRRHSPETSFGRRPPEDAPTGTVHGTEVDDIVYEGLYETSRTDKLVYFVTQDRATKVVIDYRPPA